MSYLNGYTKGTEMIAAYGWDEAVCYFEERTEIDGYDCNHNFWAGFQQALDDDCE